MYKFPLRVSFFGKASEKEHVRQLLGYQLILHEPKVKAEAQRGSKGRAKSGGGSAGDRAGKSSGGDGRSSGGAGKSSR